MRTIAGILLLIFTLMYYSTPVTPYVEYVNFPEGWGELPEFKKYEVIGVEETRRDTIDGVAYISCEIQVKEKDLELGEGILRDPETNMPLEMEFRGKLEYIEDIIDLVHEDVCSFS